MGSHGVELRNSNEAKKKNCLCVGWPDHSRSLQGKDAEYYALYNTQDAIYRVCWLRTCSYAAIIMESSGTLAFFFVI